MSEQQAPAVAGRERLLLRHLRRAAAWLGAGGGHFVIALPVCAGVAAWGISEPDALALAAGYLTTSAFRALDWFFLVVVSGMVVLSLWLGFGRFGSVKLGLPDDVPEFGLASWLAMLFAAGMGVGLLFWGVAEPVLHFTGVPGREPGSPEAARQAMVVTLFHWGLHAWAVYCVAALVLAYFGFRRGTPYLPGAPLRQAFSGRWVAPVAWSADLIAVLAVALGVAGSIGLGIFQLHSGLHVLIGVSLNSVVVPVVILVLLVISYIASASTSLNQGIRLLSNLNMVLALALLLFVLLAGPTAFLLRSFVTAFGDYAVGVVGLSFQLYPYENVGGWLQGWTLTYFFWWISWAPFVGVFIARISRGRTVRQFVAGVLFVPSVFSVLWFAVFGGTSLFEELYGAGGIEQLVRQDISIALFSLFDRLPLAGVLSLVAIVLVFVFLVTSVDSATFVLGMLTSRGSINPPVARKLAWGVVLGALGAALMLSGNVDAVRAVAALGALPFTVVLVLQVAALLRSLLTDTSRTRS